MLTISFICFDSSLRHSEKRVWKIETEIRHWFNISKGMFRPQNTTYAFLAGCKQMPISIRLKTVFTRSCPRGIVYPKQYNASQNASCGRFSKGKFFRDITKERKWNHSISLAISSLFPSVFLFLQSTVSGFWSEEIRRRLRNF